MLMEGSPPAPEARVTLSNWQDPPFNRWAFSHLRELVPTQRISRGVGPVTPLPEDLQSVDGEQLVRTDGKAGTVGEVLADTFTDALVVTHGGSVVLERYAGETHPDTPHLLMSMSKSLVGCVVGCLVDRGAVDPSSLVTAYVPELEISGYSGARVRDLLDMRSGVKFSEDYTDLSSEVRLIEQAFGWRPVVSGLETGSMYEYLTTLVRDREHGGPFSYRSCETDVLGWVCERAAGERMSELLSELVWAPMGAETDAEVTCDRLGAAIHDGGICAVARDLARFGMLLLADGQSGGQQVVPAEWLRSSWTVDSEIVEAFAQSASAPFMAGGWYRNQFWFVPRPHGPVLLCLGIYGQMVYVNPATRTVAVKLSSWPIAQSAAMLHDTLRAFDTIGAKLAEMPLEVAAGDPPHPTGNEAGVPSVPNVLTEVGSWAELVKVATEAGLGTDLVVQTPYGDSGKTTFFISSSSEWDARAGEVIGETVKVMKRINNKAAAVEAVITRYGTVVGPFMTDLTGYPELTPYKGGWCGNDLFPEALSDAQRERAIDLVRRLGARLGEEGYVGFFEVDVLVDLDGDEVYLGELNPRISGTSSMTNVTAGAYADMPLFLFHLLEHMNVDYTIDVEEINERWRRLAAADVWAQLIMKEPVDSVEQILAAPRTGSYHLSDDGTLTFVRTCDDWHEVTHEDECFYLRVYAPGDYRFKGADLGILVTKGRMQTADGLTTRCLHYINGIRSMYVSEPIERPPAVFPLAYVK